MIRVLLADDHPVVRTGYRRLLEQAGDVSLVTEAGDGDAAYASYLAASPDVLVTDLSMPGGGLELIRRVLLRAPAARVLVFSMHDGALLVRRVLDAGARGFLTKASPPDGLVVAIRALHAGQRYLDPTLPPALLQPRASQDEAERLSVAERARVRSLPAARARALVGAMRAGARAEPEDDLEPRDADQGEARRADVGRAGASGAAPRADHAQQRLSLATQCGKNPGRRGKFSLFHRRAAR